MNTYKLKPNDYRYGIKLPKTKISVCILRRIESMYNTKKCQNLNKKVGKMPPSKLYVLHCVIKDPNIFVNCSCGYWHPNK